MNTYPFYRKSTHIPLSESGIHLFKWPESTGYIGWPDYAQNDAVGTYGETDPLTGVATREFMEERIVSLLHSRPSLKREKRFLLKINIALLKLSDEIQNYGVCHPLFKHVVYTIKRVCMGADTIAKMGECSFGVLITNSTLNEVYQIADALREALTTVSVPFFISSAKADYSIGIKEIDGSDENLSTVLFDTDEACHEASKFWQNKIYVHGASEDLLTQKNELRCASRVVDALNLREIELFAQAITPLCAKAESGDRYEILIRMKDHCGVLHTPGRFLKAAERYNLMRDIDRYVISSALAWLKETYGGCSKRELLSASINLSGDSLSDPFLVDFIKQELKKNPVLPSTISFEITEARAIDDMTLAVNLAKELKGLGFHLSLDDFGTGLASFSYLKAFPFDYLKIDGSFIKELNSDPVNQAIVNSVNEIAHQMGMKTVAEFVESDSVSNILRDIGIDYIQGHLVGKPMPLRAFQEKP